MDVPVKERAPRSRLTAPEDPERAVSKREFDEMVADLHGTKPGSAAAAAPPEADPAADATPEDTVMPPEAKKRTPRNRKHGRSR